MIDTEGSGGAIAKSSDKLRKCGQLRLGILIVQPSLVEYRIPFYEQLLEKEGVQLKLIAGDQTLLAGVSSRSPIERPWVQLTKNVILPMLRVYWQQGTLNPGVKAALCVVNVNPRILSTWAILILRKLMGRPTIGWGHLYSTKGVGWKSNLLRFVQYRLCSGIALYTDAEVTKAPRWMHRKRLVGLQNSSVRADDCRCDHGGSVGLDLIYVGRWEPEKKVAKLVEEFVAVVEDLPAKARLILVGGGSEEAVIREHFGPWIANGRVVLKGWIWDSESLYTLYQGSAFSVCPGYVGLNVIQSFAYGVPMIVSRDEPHSPEIAVCREGHNTLYFDGAREGTLGARLVEAYAELDQWAARREAICADIRKNWTVENMAGRFAGLIQGVGKQQSA